MGKGSLTDQPKLTQVPPSRVGEFSTVLKPLPNKPQPTNTTMISTKKIRTLWMKPIKDHETGKKMWDTPRT